MTKNKKLALGAGAFVGTVLVALVVLPLLFVGPLEDRLRLEVERASGVRVTWTDVGLSLIRDFPDPRLTVRDLTVVATGAMEGDTLVSVGDLRLALGGASVVRSIRGRGPLEIRSLDVVDPMVRLRVDEEGRANWDVRPEGEAGETTDGGGRGLAVSLRGFEMSGGSLVYDDRASGTFVSVQGLDHTLDGDFSRGELVAETRAAADSLTVRFAGTPYLSGVAFALEGAFDVDMEEARARVVETRVRLNDLLVEVDGDLARSDDVWNADLAFEAPSTGFGEILSLVPVIYARDFAALSTSGSFELDGNVRGAVGGGAFPSFAVRVVVADGRFRYPDLDLPAEAISADLAITNPGGDVDSTVVELSRFHAEIGAQPIDAALTLRTPVSDPAVDGRVEGVLDLAALARTIKLEDAGDLSGVILADARIRARRSDVDEARYDRIAAEGTLSARDLSVVRADLRQPVTVREAELRLTPATAELRTFDAQLGASDIQATAELENVLGFALGDQPLTGVGRFTSRRFDLDEWRPEDETREAIGVPPMLDLVLDGSIETLVVQGLETRNARGRAVIRDRRLTLEDFTLETLGGRVAMDGYYETVEPETPTFALQLGLDSLNVAGASEAFLTVRSLAPVARYAQGTFSSSLSLSGVLGQDLAPVLGVLDGNGSLSTSRLVIEGFPPLQRLGERTGLERLSSPVVQALRSTIRIEDGRFHIAPFDVGVGGIPMTVSGSNGFDQSLDYALQFEVPRTGVADDAFTSLASRLGSFGSGLASVQSLPVTVRMTGSVTQPSLDLSLRESGRTLREAATRSVTAPVEGRVEEVRAQADSAREAARRRAQAQADSIVADARRRAEAIRSEAAQAAARIRAEGDQAAEALLARATNPIARAAAEPAAQRIRAEADERAAALEREADARATALVTEAEERAAALVGGGPGS